MTTPAAAIVVGVDGSPASVHAVDWATREALSQNCPLRIVHAFLWPLYNVPLGPPPFGPPDAGFEHFAERILAHAADRARRAAPGLDVSTSLPVRAPAAALIEASHDAALVVVGHRGLGGFAGLLLGSVGVQTAAHAACPVVVVRGSYPGETSDNGRGRPGPAGHVVVGVDGSDLSSLAVDFAFAHAALHGLGVVAVHAYRGPTVTAPDQPRIAAYDIDDLQEDHTRLLADALAGYRDKYPDVPVQEKIVPGRSAAALVAESNSAALTVVGSRGRGGFSGLLLGSTSQSALHHACSPIAIVRAHSSDRSAPSGTDAATGYRTPNAEDRSSVA
jgi:nucleotide-binding universal stress UspA family protein